MSRWDVGWADPDSPFGDRGAWYPWPLKAPPIDRTWAMRSVAARRTRDWIPYGHARWVWVRLGVIVEASPARKGSVDADMAFLALLGQHVVSCQGYCRRDDPNGGRSTGETWLWRAVGRVERLKALAVPLDGE